jgi:conjugal transfer pilus assembly protein TraI
MQAVLKRFKSWLYPKDLPTSAPEPAHGGVKPRPDFLEEPAIPRYPPFQEGFPAVTVEAVIASQDDLVRKARGAVNLKHEDFQAIVVPMIRQFASYVHLLPASEKHHHRGAGGLFRHGLETGFYAARAAGQYTFGNGPLQETSRQENCWRVAAFVAGMLHDIGKPLTDITIADSSGRLTWNPYISNLDEWLQQNNVDRYFLHWNADRHQRHEQMGMLVAERILVREALQFLSQAGNDLMVDLMQAVAGVTAHDNQISELSMWADSESTSRDMREQRMDLDNFAYSVPIERYLFDAIRHLVKRGKWSCNKQGAKVWVDQSSVYILWRAGIEDITGYIKAQEVKGVPQDPDLLADIMIERGYATVNRDTKAGGGKHRYWKIKPAGAPGSVMALRFDDHALIYPEDVPEPVEIELIGPEGIQRPSKDKANVSPKAVVDGALVDTETGEVLEDPQSTDAEPTQDEGSEQEPSPVEEVTPKREAAQPVAPRPEPPEVEKPPAEAYEDEAAKETASASTLGALLDEEMGDLDFDAFSAAPERDSAPNKSNADKPAQPKGDSAKNTGGAFREKPHKDKQGGNSQALSGAEKSAAKQKEPPSTKAAALPESEPPTKVEAGKESANGDKQSGVSDKKDSPVQEAAKPEQQKAKSAPQINKPANTAENGKQGVDPKEQGQASASKPAAEDEKLPQQPKPPHSELEPPPLDDSELEALAQLAEGGKPAGLAVDAPLPPARDEHGMPRIRAGDMLIACNQHQEAAKLITRIIEDVINGKTLLGEVLMKSGNDWVIGYPDGLKRYEKDLDHAQSILRAANVTEADRISPKKIVLRRRGITGIFLKGDCKLQVAMLIGELEDALVEAHGAQDQPLQIEGEADTKKSRSKKKRERAKKRKQAQSTNGNKENTSSGNFRDRKDLPEIDGDEITEQVLDKAAQDFEMLTAMKRPVGEAQLGLDGVKTEVEEAKRQVADLEPIDRIINQMIREVRSGKRDGELAKTLTTDKHYGNEEVIREASYIYVGPAAPAVLHTKLFRKFGKHLIILRLREHPEIWVKARSCVYVRKHELRKSE